SQVSEQLHADRLTALPRPATRTRRICSRRSRAAWTNCCGWSRLTHKRRIEILPAPNGFPELNMKTNSLLRIAPLLIGSLLTGCGQQAKQAAPPPPTVSVVEPD